MIHPFGIYNQKLKVVAVAAVTSSWREAVNNWSNVAELRPHLMLQKNHQCGSWVSFT